MTPRGHFARQLRPLGVPGDHGIDDRDERLVTGEDSVAAGEQMPSSHPWQQCSLRISMTRPSAERNSSVGTSGNSKAREVASKTACSRFELVSSGQKSRKLRASLLSRKTSRSRVRSTREFSALTEPGLATSTAYVV